MRLRLKDYLGKHNLYPLAVTPLGTGFGIRGYRLSFEDGRSLAIKADLDNQSDEFIIEAEMLERLQKAGWPVPDVISADDRALLMTWLENDQSPLRRKEEYKTGALLAQLHRRSGDFYGYEKSTPIGRLPQSNNKSQYWVPFFKFNRLLYMAEKAREENQLSEALYDRILAFSENLGDHLGEPDAPALIHGDIWGGNIINSKGELKGFIDPAIYFAHPEIELSFTRMFNTFGPAFYEGYQSITPLEPGFFKERVDIYNLYPTLVHVRLFGAGYLAPIEQTLKRFGY